MAMIDGLVSGLDTTSIIKQLVSLEQQPVTRMQQRSADEDARLNALRSIQTQFDAVRAAGQVLLRPSTYNSVTATSSATDRVGVTAAPTAAVGRVAVRVQQLATAHQIMTTTSIGDGAALAGAGQVVVGSGLAALGATSVTTEGTAAAGVQKLRITDAGGGQMVVTLGSNSVTVASNAAAVSIGGVTLSFGNTVIPGEALIQVASADANTTVASLVSMLNVTGGPASGQIVNMGSSTTPDRRLVLSARATGSAGGLLVGVHGLAAPVAGALGSFTTIGAAQDAKIELGTTGNVVTRSSNKVDDLFDGLTLDLKQADPGTTITIDTTPDTANTVSQVKSWVDAINKTLSAIDAKTSYDPATKKGGVLLGDSSVRAARDSLVDALTTIAGSGTYTALAQVGVSIQRNGQFAVDETALRNALATDPAAVSALLSRTGTATSPGVTFTSASDTTRAGTYAVAITQASAPAALTGAAFATLAGAETLTVRLGGATTQVGLAAGLTPAQVADQLNAAFAAARLGVQASLSGGAVVLASVEHGSGITLGVTSSLAPGAGGTGLGAGAGVERTASGVDVAGTIDGQAAAGTGRQLVATTGNAAGLSLLITATTPGALGTVTFTPGVGGAVAALFGANGTITQSVSSAINASTSRKRDYDDQTARLQDRVTSTQQRLRQQFTQLEVLLNQLKSQGSRMSALIASNGSGN